MMTLRNWQNLEPEMEVRKLHHFIKEEKNYNVIHLDLNTDYRLVQLLAKLLV